MQGRLALLGLPPEVRLKIWEIYYREVARPRMRYASDIDASIESSKEIDVVVAYTCKQIYAEAWPMMLASIQLNIVYQSHSPAQLAILPPRGAREHVREILFHCHPEDYWGGGDRPPKRPVKFHKFPRLSTFRVCHSMFIHLNRLTDDAGPLRKDLEEATYQQLSIPDRLDTWKKFGPTSPEKILAYTANFGRGGWLSRLVDPQTFPEPLRLEPDSDNEYNDEDWEWWTVEDAEYSDDESIRDYSEEETEAKAAKDLKSFQGVIARMHTFLELEFRLLVGPENEPWRCKVIDVLWVVVDTKKREIIDFRLPGKEEVESREE